MITIRYVVKRIDGDYAKLLNLDRPEEEPVLVARALLPEEIEEDMQIEFRNFEYLKM